MSDFIQMTDVLNPSIYNSQDARGVFPNLLSEFIYVRTYSRWLDAEGRRETWDETVDRYIQFLSEDRPEVPKRILEAARKAIYNLQVLPSMRALWSAGETARRDNTTLYNCSFVPLDSLRAFAEALQVLMCGTGVGFSVERKFVGQLPVVAAITGETVSYVIEDSTEGWANSLWFGMQEWYKGNKVQFDYSGLRPRGAPLKTKGGRASGPEPLERLHRLCEKTVLEASGRQLKPIECHDIACAIGDIVYVGGFRRAALISFSDVHDEEMRHAKDWTRGQFPAIRYMSNNSVYYETKPSREVFDAEWQALVKSGSGERGFSMGNWHVRSNRPQGLVRSNPCVTGETRVMTAKGMVKIVDMLGSPRNLIIDSRFGTDGKGRTSDKGSFFTARKEVFALETQEGYRLRLTADHQVMTSRGWVEAQHLQIGDRVHIVNRGGSFGDSGNYDLGILAGWLTGDGCVVDNSVPRFYFYDEDQTLTQMFLDAAERQTGVRPALVSYEDRRQSFQHAPLREYLSQVCANKRQVPEFVWQGSSECQKGYLSALFTADGCVIGSHQKGVSVRLHQANLEILREVQQLLLNFGVASKIYKDRMPDGDRLLPDGRGGHQMYACQASHELVISKSNLIRFRDQIGFLRADKIAKLESHIQSWTRGPYQEKFTARVVRLVSDGVEDVYDLTEDTTHSFVANGVVVHNCHEIGLRFLPSQDPIYGTGGGGQFCNLTAAVMRAEDTRSSFAEKVRIATWLGVIQASFTKFPYLREGWKQTCEQDRLLGVDITGHCDNPQLSGDPEAMLYFNKVARETAAEAAAYMGINMPVAITCGKPSGNSSQFVDCASGFHPRYAPYYFRRVRIDDKDPLTALLRDSGVPMFKENGQENLPDDQVSVWVAQFPVKAPEGAMTRNSETALEMCNRYLHVMNTWCGERGHNQSATIYVRDHEWDEVGQWLYEHFDEVTGLSFLPYDGGQYKLAPYEEITLEQYEAAMADMPNVDFSLLTQYERDDRGLGAVELACTSGNCEM